MMERDEFDEFIESIYTPLRRHAEWLCDDPHVAQDLVQQTCLRMWRNNQHGEDIKWSRGYAIHTLRWVYHDHLRAEARARQRLEKLQQITEPIAREHDPGQRVADRARILPILQRLPERHREIFFLRECAGFEVREISELLGLKSTTVSNYLSTARTIVRRTVADLANQQ